MYVVQRLVCKDLASLQYDTAQLHQKSLETIPEDEEEETSDPLHTGKLTKEDEELSAGTAWLVFLLGLELLHQRHQQYSPVIPVGKLAPPLHFQ